MKAVATAPGSVADMVATLPDLELIKKLTYRTSSGGRLVEFYAKVHNPGNINIDVLVLGVIEAPLRCW